MSNHRTLCRGLAQAAAVCTFALTASAVASAPGPSLAANAATHQTHYTYRTLDYPGASDTILWGINDFGVMTGQYNLSGQQPHAMLYHNGHFETSNPGGLLNDNNYSAAGGPNNAGVIFVEYADGDASAPQHGLVMQWGQVKKVDFPGHINSNVDGVSLSGAITGVYWDANQFKHGVLRQHGHDISLDVAGARETWPLGNNGSGEIVGFWDTSSSVVHGFYRSLSGQVSSFDEPNAGAGGTYAFSINEEGQIVGYYYDTAGSTHGYLKVRGEFQNLDVPGALATIATNINDFGVVVGEYYDATGHTHGFVATPW